MHKVALIYDAKLPYDLKVISGIARYMHEGADFITYIEENALRNQKLPDLRTWKGDGIIANFDDPNVAESVLKSHLPVVGFGGGYGWFPRKSAIPYFYNDQKLVAQMAADHMLERGFRNFAYCGFVSSPSNLWSEERQRAYSSYLRTQGIACHIYQARHKTTRQWNAFMESMGAWLISLPKPVAIMAANDQRAHHVLVACRAFHLQVPEEISVIGVDNDELLCQLCTPELSSIEQDAVRIGYEAAAMLDRMMRGQHPRKRHFSIPPVGVVVRRSTEAFAIEDRIVNEAMSYIRIHARSGIKVEHLVHALGLSRSTLETRFRTAMGYSIHSVIQRTQIERVRQLLGESTLAIKEIAASSGFKSVPHMTDLFGKIYGQTPARYRKSLLHR